MLIGWRRSIGGELPEFSKVSLAARDGLVYADAWPCSPLRGFFFQRELSLINR